MRYSLMRFGYRGGALRRRGVRWKFTRTVYTPEEKPKRGANAYRGGRSGGKPRSSPPQGAESGISTLLRGIPNVDENAEVTPRNSPSIDFLQPDQQAAGGGIAPERIREFQKIIRRRYGVDLSYEQAAERGAKLVALYRAILGALPEAANGP